MVITSPDNEFLDVSFTRCVVDGLTTDRCIEQHWCGGSARVEWCVLPLTWQAAGGGEAWYWPSWVIVPCNYTHVKTYSTYILNIPLYMKYSMIQSTCLKCGCHFFGIHGWLCWFKTTFWYIGLSSHRTGCRTLHWNTHRPGHRRPNSHNYHRKSECYNVSIVLSWLIDLFGVSCVFSDFGFGLFDAHTGPSQFFWGVLFSTGFPRNQIEWLCPLYPFVNWRHDCFISCQLDL